MANDRESTRSAARGAQSSSQVRPTRVIKLATKPVLAVMAVLLLGGLLFAPAARVEAQLTSDREVTGMDRLARRFAANDGPADLPADRDIPSIPSAFQTSAAGPAIPMGPKKPASPVVPAVPSVPRMPAVVAEPDAPLTPTAMAARERLPLNPTAGSDTGSGADAEQAGGRSLAGQTGTQTGNAIPGRGTMAMGWVRTFGALALVIGLIFLARMGLRRLTPGGATPTRLGGALQVLGRTTMGPRQSVVLMRVGQRILVVGESAGAMRTLAEVCEPEEVADLLAQVSRAQSTSATRAFEHMLGRMNRDYDREDGPALEGAEMAEVHTDRARDQLGGLLSRLRDVVRQPLGTASPEASAIDASAIGAVRPTGAGRQGAPSRREVRA